jgi:hypothetical protein
VKPLEVLEVAVKKWILVIPLYLEGYDAAILELSNVVNNVRLGFALYSIDSLLDLECIVRPASVCKRLTQTLRTFGFSAARADNFLY